MNVNQPLPERIDTKEAGRETYYNEILKTAEQRDSVSESLLSGLGVNNAREFIEKACIEAKKANLAIEELKPNETLTKKILEIQDRVLGFKLEDNKYNCDGKLGPITYAALTEKFPRLKVAQEHTGRRHEAMHQTRATRTDFASQLPTPPPPRPREQQQQAPRETVENKNFIDLWNEIKEIGDPARLMAMRDSIELKPEDPMVTIPDQPPPYRRVTLREGAALRYALFKQYARLKGYEIIITYGHRSVEQQRKMWNNALKKYGSPRAASRWVAPPGRSHHHTGGAVDIKVIRTPDGKKFDMHRYSGSRDAFEKAVETGDVSGIANAADRRAVENRRFLDNELKAAYFLRQNYHAENWHWNIDGRQVYKNV